MWHDYFDKIYIINLESRLDRWVDVVEEMKRYDIPFERKNAIADPQGARGLMYTMQEIFKEAEEKDYDRILVFEDDCKFLEGADVNGTMEKAIEQLPDNWLLLYLGGQLTIPLTHFHSPNLLPVKGCYATHSWALSKKAIQLIQASGFDYPIDNNIVSNIQAKYGGTYITYPLLATQKAGISDIGGGQFINWDAFISQRYTQRILEFKQNGGVIPI